MKIDLVSALIFEKSMVFFSSNTSEDIRGKVLESLGIRGSSDMEKYLGLPNLIGNEKRSLFNI